MLRTVCPGQLGGDIAMVLEKIEMSPGLFLKIMGIAHPAAYWTRIFCATISLYLDSQLIG